MVGMIVTNGQLGISRFEGNGAFAFNSRGNSFSPSESPLRWGPSLGVYLNVNDRRLSFGTICKALPRGDSNGQLIGVSLPGKEAEFRPSFNEYLKVMESVKTVRDKRQSNSFQKKKFVDKSMETGSSEGNEDGVKLEELEEHSNQEKDYKRYESLNRRDSLTNKNGIRKNMTDPKSRIGMKVGNVIGKETRKSGGRDSMDRDWPKYQTGREEVELDENHLGRKFTKLEGYKSTGKRIPSQAHDNSMDMGRGYRNDIGFNKINEKVGRNYVEDDSKEIMPKHGKQTKRTNDFGKKVDDNNLSMERAAFRNLDEFGDIMENPRLPRNVMEERIQKLANSLNGADVDMPEWMFSKMMRSARIRFTDHSILRVIQILGKFGNWRRVLQVIEWLQIRERFKSHKTRFVYTTALHVLGKARRPVEALNVFNAMQQQISSYPDLVAYHSIAVTLGQAGHMKELFDVIDTMRSPPKKKFKTGALGEWDPRVEPDIVVYNAVLNACVKRTQWEGAFWVLQQLKEKSVQPTATTYGLVMEVMYACGKYNLVHDFFRKIQKSSTPNALTYRVLVNTLWKEGKLDEAVLAVQNMENRGIVGSAALYYDFARCLCSAGRCQEALAQIEKICKVANKPLVVTYTGLIQACLDSGNVKDGAYMFNHMRKFCSPNLVTCNIMLKAYLNHGMFKEGKELFKMMLEDGNGLRSKADHNVLVEPDIYTFNTLLDACVSEKKWDDFEYFYKKMLHRGYHFNSKRHLQMILEASRAGKGELLDITWNYLVEADRTPPASLIKERLCMKLEKEDYVAALSCIQNQGLLAALPDFSVKAWSRLFKVNSERFQEGTLVRFVQEVSNIVARSDQPNPAVDNLLESCKELTRNCVGSTQIFSERQTELVLTI
ncbi:hypothetical protein CsatB_001474 [Cannabis sativa]